MSPSRPSETPRRNSSSKPYTRSVTPLTNTDGNSEGHEASPNNCPDDSSFDSSVAATPLLGCDAPERQGFPTYAQYKQVETAYIQSLTPRRQAKALISQSMFDRIWDVLMDPDYLGETAQFRFWARKMFKISKTHDVTLGVNTDEMDEPQEVLLHDDLLVAVQEQLYDLLCYCHGSTGHGGRDKTCAMIRKHYTWVPKDLVSSFIKACPTCIMKKCGGLGSAAIANSIAEQNRAAEEAAAAIAAAHLRASQHLGDSGANSSSLLHPSPLIGLGTPLASSTPVPGHVPWPHVSHSPRPGSSAEDLLSVGYGEHVHRSAPSMNLGFDSSSHAQPMVREVSLYKGIPDGWQYTHSTYESAHAEFMKTRGLSLVEEGDLGVQARRPRIPSIAPLWGPDFPLEREVKQEDIEVSAFSEDLDLGDPSASQLSGFDTSDEQRQSRTIGSMSLQYLMCYPDEDPRNRLDTTPQIDPVLMRLSSPSVTSPELSMPGDPSFSGSRTSFYQQEPPLSPLLSGTMHSAGSSIPASSSIKRFGVPSLHIDLPPPQPAEIFKDLLAYRDSEGVMTPEIVHSPWSYADSPARSVASGYEDQTITQPPSPRMIPTQAQLAMFPSFLLRSTGPLPPPMRRDGSSGLTSVNLHSSSASSISLLPTPVDENTVSPLGEKGKNANVNRTSWLKGKNTKLRMMHNATDAGEQEGEAIHHVLAM